MECLFGGCAAWALAALVLPAAAVAAGEGSALETAAAMALQQPHVAAAVPERASWTAVAAAGKRLVGVGEHGVIALSDDGGRRWRSAKSPTDITLTQVRFADAQRGWAVGHMGLVLHTSDGGETWRRQLDGVSLAGLALAQAQAATGTERSALEAWAQGLRKEGPDKPWLDLWIAGNEVTLVGAFGLMAHSPDAGRSWVAVPSAALGKQAGHLYGIARTARGYIVVGEQGLVLQGTRPDQPWRKLASPYPGSWFGLLVMGGDDLLAFGLQGNVMHSVDGGATWQPSSVQGTAASFNAATVLANGNVVLCDQAGRLFVSNDKGRSLKSVPSGGAPATGIVPTADAAVVISTLAGPLRLDPATLEAALRASAAK